MSMRRPRPRTARPTDIVALVAFDGRIFPNEARPWDQLGCTTAGPHVLTSAFEQWFSFATGRATWVSVQGQTVRGVISARRRASRLAWEIDTLIAAADDPAAVALTLLSQVVAGAVRAGAHTIFVRVEAGSDLLPAAHQAGFVSYARETLLRLDSPWSLDAVTPPAGSRGADTPSAALMLRPRLKGDAYALYQLYCRATPAAVRQVEATTFQEWLAAREERSRGRGRVDLIAEYQSRAMAWVRASRDADLSRLDLLVHPDAWPATEDLLAAGLAGLRQDRPVYTLVREDARPVQQRLEAAGFARAGEYVSLAKRLALPVRELRVRRVPMPALVKPLIAKPLQPAISDTSPASEPSG